MLLCPIHPSQLQSTACLSTTANESLLPALRHPNMKTNVESFKKTRYGSTVKPHNPLYHPVTIALRCLFAFVMALIFAPLTAPAFIQMPPILPVRLLERVAVRILSLIASVAAVEALIRPRSDPMHESSPHMPWLIIPLVRFWTSPLPQGRYVRTYDQPGRWMTDAQLTELQEQLEEISVSSIGSIPTHRLFDRRPGVAREVFSNRVVSVAHDREGPLGFTAMVYLDCQSDVVIHLGLTMMGMRGRGKRLQSALFTKSLLLPVINLCRTSYHVTNVAASPAGIGNVSDYFFDCYPTYRMNTQRRDHHVLIARHVLDHYRYEFGCSEFATFDEHNFVVYKSNAPEGGGTHQFIKEDGSPVSQHKSDKCNKFVAGLIDFAAGDELFQVATVNVVGSMFRYVTRTNKHGRNPK